MRVVPGSTSAEGSVDLYHEAKLAVASLTANTATNGDGIPAIRPQK